MHKRKEAEKVKEFGEESSGKISHYINDDPACIMGFKGTAIPYSTHLATILSIGLDVIPGVIDVVKGKVKGFYQSMVKGRKVVVITDTPYDRGSIYARLIAKRYKELEKRYNMRGFMFVTTSPFEMHSVEDILVRHNPL